MPRFRLLPISLALLGLAACQNHVQTTSGTQYLARYEQLGLRTDATDVDADVRRIAAIEPTLQFPARIGLARIHRGELTAIPADEGEIWFEAATTLGPDYGEFVPVSPLVTAMVGEPAAVGTNRASAVIANIRRGAARQHLDYVLVYEVGSATRNKSNALSVADLTIVGMFVLPSRSIKAEASASAILLDVRSGYPYATLSGHADEKGISRAVSSWTTRLDLADTAEARAVANLAGEVTTVMPALVARAADLPPVTETVARARPEALSPMQEALQASTD